MKGEILWEGSGVASYSLDGEVVDPQRDGPGRLHRGPCAPRTPRRLPLEQDAQLQADDGQALGVRAASESGVEHLQRTCNPIVLPAQNIAIKLTQLTRRKEEGETSKPADP